MAASSAALAVSYKPSKGPCQFLINLDKTCQALSSTELIPSLANYRATELSRVKTLLFNRPPSS